MAGPTLRERLASGPLTAKEIVDFGGQLSDGLAEAHARGIVHHDLKPENIKITPDGRLKILDFGIARMHTIPTDSITADSTDVIDERSIVGTMPYMAPEQLRGEPTDARTDVFATGSVLYEMCTGKRAFGETAVPRLIDSILNQMPQIDRKVPLALQRIIRKCLQKNPRERYQSAAELGRDLRSGRVIPWRWIAAAAVAAMVITAAAVVGIHFWPSTSRIHSVAVLPLQNLSGDPQQEYFADGMTEELTAALARVSNLRVISRTSTMQYKNTRKTVREIARELNVEAVIEGSVLRAGNRVRIVARLIEANQDRYLWTETYERDLGDVLSLQNELSRTVAQAIKVRLTPLETSRLSVQRPVDPEALDLYLQGKQLLRPGNAPDAPRKALVLFQKAVEKEPRFALAHAGIADSYVFMGSGSFFGPQGNQAQTATNAFSNAEESAQRALILDSSLAEAHEALAAVRAGRAEWAESIRESRNALELNPNLASAYEMLAYVLSILGRHSESLEAARRSSQIDPLAETLANTLFRARRYEEAIRETRRVIAAGGPGGMRLTLIRIFLRVRRYPEAMAELEQLPMVRTIPGGSANMHAAFAANGPRGLLRWCADATVRQTRRPWPPGNIAWFYAMAGDKEHALVLLKQAFDEKRIFGTWPLTDPGWDLVRSDPRFRELLAQANLPGSLADIPDWERVPLVAN